MYIAASLPNHKHASRTCAHNEAKSNLAVCSFVPDLSVTQSGGSPPGVDVVQRVHHHVQPLPEAVVEHVLCGWCRGWPLKISSFGNLGCRCEWWRGVKARQEAGRCGKSREPWLAATSPVSGETRFCRARICMPALILRAASAETLLLLLPMFQSLHAQA